MNKFRFSSLTHWAPSILDRKFWPRHLFLLLCTNLVMAPAVQAATGQALSRPQAYCLGLLTIATIAYSLYLFVVMFQPERF